MFGPRSHASWGEDVQDLQSGYHESGQDSVHLQSEAYEGLVALCCQYW